MAKFPNPPVRTNIIVRGSEIDAPPYPWERWFQSVSDFNSAPKIPQSTPASSTAKGVQGTIISDGAFIYVCTAPNVWKRAALSAF